MKAALASMVLCMLAVPAAALACEGERTAAEKVKRVEVAQLVELQKRDEVKVLDVNSAKTRAEQGVIPGAALLSGAASYDVARELPAAKETPLVFYCANERCRASHSAAERAVEAGYRDVAILPAGIAGWRAAGQQTDRPKS